MYGLFCTFIAIHLIFSFAKRYVFDHGNILKHIILIIKYYLLNTQQILAIMQISYD